MATHEEVPSERVPAPAGVVGQSPIFLNRESNTHTLMVTETISCMMASMHGDSMTLMNDDSNHALEYSPACHNQLCYKN